MCLATRGSHIVSSSGSWLKAKRVSWHTFGEIKVILYKVDVACEGQGHAGSTPATSTFLNQKVPSAAQRAKEGLRSRPALTGRGITWG